MFILKFWKTFNRLWSIQNSERIISNFPLTITNLSTKKPQRCLELEKNSTQLSVNPIIKRNIVIPNELWNQRSLMLIDPCFMWSRALKHLCAINHFRLVYASFTFHSLRASNDNDDENKSLETTPTIRDRRVYLKVDIRSFMPCVDHFVAIPGLLLVHEKSVFFVV